jgi:chitin synthase
MMRGIQMPPPPPPIPGTYPYPMPASAATTPYSFKRPIVRSNTKRVELVQGNLILDCPIPSRLMEASARKDKEFSMMRYSAVTCDPDEFVANNYTLRPKIMNRNTELFIVMTMYNVSNCQ